MILVSLLYKKEDSLCPARNKLSTTIIWTTLKNQESKLSVLNGFYRKRQRMRLLKIITRVRDQHLKALNTQAYQRKLLKRCLISIVIEVLKKMFICNYLQEIKPMVLTITQPSNRTIIPYTIISRPIITPQCTILIEKLCISAHSL